MKYDAIIIGSGLSSLTAGAKLSKSGKKVLIIEKNKNIGGAAGYFKNEDFLFDISLHNFGPYQENEQVFNIFKELELDNKLIFINYPYYQKLIFPEHEIKVNKGFSNFIEYLTELFPKDSKGLKKLSKIAAKIFNEFNDFQKQKIGVDEIEEKLPSFPMSYPNISFLASKTLDTLLNEYLTNDKLKGIFGNLWWLFGIKPDELASVLYLSPLYGYFEYAGGIFENTSQVIVNLLSDVIKSNNGTIITDCEADKIILDSSNKVSGITDKNKINYYSDKVISGCGCDITFNKLLNIKSIESENIKNIPQSLSVISIFIGLDISPEEINIKDHSLSIFESYNHNENYNFSFDNNFEKSTLIINIPSLYDKTIIKSSQTTINILTLCNSEKTLNIDEATSKIIDRVNKVFPLLKENIKTLKIISPDDLIKYTGTSALYGYSQTPEFSGVKRFSNLTSIEGLFITGKDTFPGAGFPSVIISGELVAERIITSK